MRDSIVRDGHFQPVGTEVRLDSKGRVSVPKKARSTGLYKVYRNDSGQIILDPQVVLPAAEAWLFKNKKALASVRRGLKAAASGKKGKYLGSFAKYAAEKLDD